MKVQIRDREPFQSLSPNDVAAYLRTAGWREVDTKPEHSSIWLRKVDGEEAEILLPLNRSFRDFALRMAEVVAMVAAVEDRSQLAVLADLQEASADVLRVDVRLAEGDDGTVPLDRGVSLVENARAMMLAAACATVEPRARFGNLKPGPANDFVRRLRLGQTERGSYVLRILSRVPPALKTQETLFGDQEEPFERRVLQTLTRALRTLRMAADQALASGRFDRLAAGVREGVSSNLCEAVVHMGGPVQGTDELVFSWTWARSRPAEESVGVVRTVTVPGDRLPIIAEAARLLRAMTPLESCELRGAVVKLPGANGHGLPAGTVTILAFVNGGPRQVNMMLAAADYPAAVEAYQRGATVACAGDLVRQGSHYSLQNARGFTVLPDD